jgi:hypothetical protein
VEGFARPVLDLFPHPAREEVWIGVESLLGELVAVRGSGERGSAESQEAGGDKG